VAGTIYGAIHYAVFSNFQLLSVIEVYRLISTVPKPNLQSFLNVTDQVPTHSYKILHKHTHVYTAIASFLKVGRSAKHYEAAVCISRNSYPLKFFTLQFILHTATPKYFRFPTLPKFSNNVSDRSHFNGRYPHCNSGIHTKRRKVGCQ
jgi:hypothetical protein